MKQFPTIAGRLFRQSVLDNDARNVPHVVDQDKIIVLFSKMYIMESSLKSNKEGK
jgi:hypothetical protein